MLLLPLVTLYKMFQEKDNMIGKVVLGLLLAGLVFILLEKLEVKLIDKHPSNHFFLNQMDLINKHIFGNILSNPLVIVGFVLILNILLIACVWSGVQEKAKQIEIGRECDLINECEPISFCPFKGLTSRKKAGLVCPLMKKEKSCDTESTEKTHELMNKMKETEIGENKAVEFAKKALTTRFSEKEMKRITIDIKDILKPVRKEDAGKDLWSIFNVVQEKVIDGDFNYTVGSKIRKARKIKNFKQDQKVNKELFALALEYVN